MSRATKLLGLAFASAIILATLYTVSTSEAYGAHSWRHYEIEPHHGHAYTPDSTYTSNFTNTPDFTAGNSTLGFNAILALSQGTQWRVDGLRAAARVSGIDLVIPPQPGWSTEFISAFEAFGPVEAHGAAMAWLGHIDLLKFVIQNNWGSALIMEDDVDWDVAVRDQTRSLAPAVLKLRGQKQKEKAPWGEGWDVIWMGHCSDPTNIDWPYVAVDDPTVIPLDRYIGLNTYIAKVLKSGKRYVHPSFNPVCTFAYAVSAKGARNVLNLAATGKGGAFDLMMLHACQDKVLDCITVNPEIFDPYHPAGGDISEVRAGDNGVAFDASGEKAMGNTDNIMHSARCHGLWGSDCLNN